MQKIRVWSVFLPALFLLTFSACVSSDKDSGTQLSSLSESRDSSSSSAQGGVDPSDEDRLYLRVGDHLLIAALEKNSSAEALVELLREGPVEIDMRDYANMEKVGELPLSLPRNDEQIDTVPGDLILYQGNSFVIYYDTNSWALTRLGKIINAGEEELKDILGEGDVSVVISLSSEKGE